MDAGNSYGEEYRLSKSVGIFANVKQTVQFLVKKIIKRSHRLNVNVMLSNVTFLMIFGGFDPSLLTLWINGSF